MCYKKLLPFFVMLTAVCILIASCKKLDLYQKLKWFPEQSWLSSDTASFNFNIEDSSFYKIYFVVRHTDAYHYNNIWLNMTVKDPDTTYVLRREFVLADNSRWLGSGMGDVFEHRLAFSNTASRFKPGNYQFKMVQAMREDPLENVINVGIRLERQQ